jgi:hypothetical protein
LRVRLRAEQTQHVQQIPENSRSHHVGNQTEISPILVKSSATGSASAISSEVSFCIALAKPVAHLFSR